MSCFDPEQFEAELSQLRPARPPAEVLERIAQSFPAARRVSPVAAESARGWRWAGLARWLVPAGAVALVLSAWYLKPAKIPAGQPQHLAATPAGPVLKADKVEIDRQLLADFDAIANLPSGEPVRFRCEQWLEKIRWRDSTRGLVIEQDVPRLEIVPIRFETY